MARARNILIVMMDGCPAARISLNGHCASVTPMLDALRGNAFVLKKNYGTSYCTLPNYTSMMTGLYPVVHKACGTYSYYDGTYPMLPNIFSHNGYQTFAVFNNVPGVSPEFGVLAGYNLFYRIGKREDWFKATTEEKRGVVKPPLYKRLLRRLLNEVKNVSPKKHDALFTTAVLNAFTKKDMGGAAAVAAFERFLSERDSARPFFGMLCLPDTHHPYIVPEPFMSRMGVANPTQNAVLFNFKAHEFVAGKRTLEERDKRDLDKMFNASVAYVDALVGRVVSLLRENKLFDDTLIVLMSDHGGNIGERRNYLGSTCFTYDTEVHTVLTLVNAGRVGECEHLSSTVDLFPTLLHYAGLECEAKGTHGTNVLAPYFSGHESILVDYPMMPEWLQQLGFTHVRESLLFGRMNRTLVTSEGKKLIWLNTGQHEYYDIDADPHEQRNLFSWDNPEAVAAIEAMREKYREYVGDKADYLERYDFNDCGYGYKNVPPIAEINPSAARMRVIDLEKSPDTLQL